MLDSLEKAIEKIGYKDYRINTEKHLLKQLQPTFNLKLICTVSVFGRKTINYRDMEDIQEATKCEVVMQVGHVAWCSLTYYKSKDCFIICLLEKEVDDHE